MSNLMISAAGPAESAAQLAASKPLTTSASLAESSARLKIDHEEFAASLVRLRDFALAGDQELCRGEWDELEAALLRHIDAEEMFLLPGFGGDEPVEAARLSAEHAEIRRQLGEVGLALDLHTLNVEQIDELSRAVIGHARREEAGLFPWAAQAKNDALLDAIARRLPHAFHGPTREARTAATLLGLLRVCHDGEQGYRRAAVDSDDPGHQALFARLADERAQYGRDLRDQLGELGVTAELKGTLFGALHRGWIDAATKLAAGKAKALLRECERGEELALRVYRTALRTDLPPAVRDRVEAQHADLERALNDIRAVSATAT